MTNTRMSASTTGDLYLRLGLALAGLILMVEDACAALPAPTVSKGTLSTSDWLGSIEAFARSGGATAAKLIAGGFMLYLGVAAAMDINAVRKEEKEWSEVGFGNVVGAVIFLVISYILNQLDSIFT